ncbi:MAG: hypothetical protein GXP49_09265 [Deltaproteobacteria bacterium]|nr:hypothetical protein [Deltaproteobacteria bacterium]
MNPGTAGSGDLRRRFVSALSRAQVIAFWIFVVAIPLNLIAMTAGAAIGIAATLGLYISAPYRRHRTPLDLAVIIYLAAIGASLLLGRTDAITFRTATSFWPLAVFYFSYSVARYRRDSGERWIWVMLCTALVLSIYSIVQHFTGIDWFNTAFGGQPKVYRHMLAGSAHRYVSVGRYDRHSNHAFAVMFFLSLALSEVLFGSQKTGNRIVKTVGKWGAGLLFAAELVVTYVRAAWMGMAAAVFFLGMAKGRRWLLAMILGGAVLFGAVCEFSPSIESKLKVTFDSKYPANRQRLFLWARSLEMFADHPVFGIGWGNYQKVCPEYIDKVDPKFPFKFRSHNLFLNHLAETGLVGLLALLFLFFKIFSSLYSCVKRSGQGGCPGYRLCMGMLAAMIAFVIGSITTDAYYNGDVSFVMWFLLGQALGARTDSDDPAAD